MVCTRRTVRGNRRPLLGHWATGQGTRHVMECKKDLTASMVRARIGKVAGLWWEKNGGGCLTLGQSRTNINKAASVPLLLHGASCNVIHFATTTDVASRCRELTNAGRASQ